MPVDRSDKSGDGVDRPEYALAWVLAGLAAWAVLAVVAWVVA